MVAEGSKSPILEARGIHKRFLAVQALDDVSASFHAGEVVAVIGENGAGKSTLMKCLAGVHRPDKGEILLDGSPVTIPSVNRATELGIAFIHQELNLADNLDVGANIFLGREPKRCGVFVDRRTIYTRTEALLSQLGMRFAPDVPVEELSIGHQQMVEIAKALSQEARVLIMDEPTSSLTQHETDLLFKTVDRLREEGMCIVFISHRLAEIQLMADRVIVLRDGKNSGDLAREEISHDRMVSLMVGRDFDLHHKGASQAGDVVLEVKDLCVTLRPKTPVSFTLRAGEVVGMAGLVGAGRTEVVRTLFGIDRPVSGSVKVNGKPISIRSAKAAIAAGMALVPEDRKKEGIIIEMTIRDNVALAGLDRYSKLGFANDRKIDEVARSAKERLNIKATNVETEIHMLSGGNQQKVVLAKWIALNPSIFLLDEPTRGIDVMSKSEIYELVESMAAEGAAILFISSELEEVMRVSDRIIVMHEGSISGELPFGQFSEEAIMNLATGN